MLDALADRRPGLLTYGVTPPKRSWPPERVAEVAARQSARMRGLAAAGALDAVVVYDLQDESARTDVPRPFPYEPCTDPVAYAYDHLVVDVPRVVYRCVAPLGPGGLRASLDRLRAQGGAGVLVGAASSEQPARLRLPDAYALRRAEHPDVPLGGVLIGERHGRRRREHERVLAKVDKGCSFFVTQAVYDTTPTKDVLSDLLLRCRTEDRPVPPVLVTLTPCGSERTLTFLRWLGVEVPRWLENELLTSSDTLATSVRLCLDVLADLHAWAAPRGVPLGCNVESVSLSRAEVEASVDLLRGAAEVLGRTTARAA